MAGQPPSDDPSLQPQIINGRPASEVYPFFASLQNSSGSHFCGGSLIRPQWVVTAAHCVSSTPYQVRIGSTDYTSGGEVIRVDRKVVHPDYDGDHDIAVLHLAQPAQATPIAIAADSGSTGAETRLIGHGQTCPTQGCGGQSRQLMEVDVVLQADSGCVGIDGPGELCLGENGEGACYGDSGGPSVRKINGRWELTGATSRAGTGSATCAGGLKVAVAIKHTWRGDLVIDLVAPDGSAYRLKNASGNDSADDVNETYTVDASAETANGTWKLRVRDVYAGDTGYIDSWALQF